jgi:hypothetical protein
MYKTIVTHGHHAPVHRDMGKVNKYRRKRIQYHITFSTQTYQGMHDCEVRVEVLKLYHRRRIFWYKIVTYCYGCYDYYQTHIYHSKGIMPQIYKVRSDLQCRACTTYWESYYKRGNISVWLRSKK